MKTVSVFSKKLGKSMVVTAESSKKNHSMGWMKSGWSKSGGWKVPVSK